MTNIIDVKQRYLFISYLNRSSFFIKFRDVRYIWFFNCFEGCQNVIIKKKIKASQIVKIIITDLNISNISGLLGLLSSLSLNAHIDKIDIYGPQGLDLYLCLGRKYSQTNFRYKLLIHTVSTGLIFKESDLKLFASVSYYGLFSFDYYIMFSEVPGQFNVIHALNYKLPIGPLYGKLKIGYNFIMPDGHIFYGVVFILNYNLGVKINMSLNNCTRTIFEVLKYVDYNLYK